MWYNKVRIDPILYRDNWITPAVNDGSQVNVFDGANGVYAFLFGRCFDVAVFVVLCCVDWFPFGF